MPARLAKSWDWTAADGYLSVATAASDLVLAFSPNSGVVALRPQPPSAELVWRHPDPAGEWIELVGAVGGVGRSRLFVAFQQAWSAPVLHALSVADGGLAWERALGQGIVYSAAADDRYVYLHQGSRSGQQLRAFAADDGAELAGLDLPAAVTSLATPEGTTGRVLYGAGEAVLEYDVSAGASQTLADQVLRPTADQQLGSVVAVGQRAYVADGAATVAAIDRAAGLLWHQVLPDQPNLGEPVYAADLDALVVGGLDGQVYCLAAADGAVRWVTQCEGPSSSQTVGVPVALRGPAGPFVVFPGLDETLYLADATSGAILDRARFDWPLEFALHAHGDAVIVPHALGVTAFELRD